MDIVLNAAFVLAITAFLKQQFDLSGKAALLAAFLVALAFGLFPLVAISFPVVAPFIGVILNTFVLFLGSAGAYDAIVDLKTKKA